jgi:hypothetical protein
VLSLFGMMLFIIAAVDAVCALLGWSFTAYSWSPLIFGVLGFLLIALEALERDHSPDRAHRAGAGGRT